MVIKFLGLIVFTWLFTEGAAPVQFIKKFFGVDNESKAKDVTRRMLILLLNCSLCMGFWFGLIFLQDLWAACLLSICAELFHRIINIIFDRI